MPRPATGRVSVVVVTYNSERDIGPLAASIAAHSRLVREVIVVDNASTDGTAAALRAIEGTAGLTILRNARNEGYSIAANRGIRAATGDLVVLLNPDTRVTEGWDARLAAHADAPGVGAVGPVSNYVSWEQRVERYLDEVPQRIDLESLARAVASRNAGRSLESRLLIGFCLMVPRRVFDEVGLFDETLVLGNDDLDFSWRLGLAGKKLLIATDVFVYHRGQVSFGSRPRAETDAAVEASTDRLYLKLEAHYGRGRVPPGRDLWGIEWFRPTALAGREEARPDGPAPRTSIVIPVHDQLSYTKLCLENLRRFTKAGEYEIVVVDDGSRDGTAEFLSGEKDVRVVTNPSNLGFPAACNRGIRAARATNEIVLLNNDVVVTEGWLEGLLRAAAPPDVGLAGPVTNRVKGRQKDESAGYDDLDDMRRHAAETARRRRGIHVEAETLMGFCLLVKRGVFERIGLLDERFGLGNYEDDDLCLRAGKAGFRLRIASDVFVHHYGSRTFAARAASYDELLERNRKLFDEKWRKDGVTAAPRTPAWPPLPEESAT